jgi:hypothetical protein
MNDIEELKNKAGRLSEIVNDVFCVYFEKKTATYEIANACLLREFKYPESAIVATFKHGQQIDN